MAAESTFTFRLGIASREDGLAAKLAADFAEKVAAETNGRIVLDVVVNSSPRGHIDIMQELSSGRYEFALVENWAIGERFPPLAMVNQPFLFANDSRAFGFYHGAGGASIAETLRTTGIRVLTWLPCTEHRFLSAGPLDSEKAFEGMTVVADSPNAVVKAVVEHLGGSFRAAGSAEELAGALSSGAAGAVYGDLSLLESIDSGGAKTITAVTAHFPYLALCGADSAMAEIQGELKERFEKALETASVVIVSERQREELLAQERLTERGFSFAYADYGTMCVRVESLIERVEVQSDSEMLRIREEVNAPSIQF